MKRLVLIASLFLSLPAAAQTYSDQAASRLRFSGGVIPLTTTPTSGQCLTFNGTSILGGSCGGFPSGVTSWASVADGEGVYRTGVTLDGFAFSTGLTLSGGALTANVSVGVAGGQSIIGGVASGTAMKIRGNSATAGSFDVYSTAGATTMHAQTAGTTNNIGLYFDEAAGATNLFSIASYGTAYASGGLAGYTNITNAGAGGIQYLVPHATAGHYFYTGAGSSLAMTIDPSQYVVTPKNAMATASAAATGYTTSTSHATKGTHYLTQDLRVAVDEANLRFGLAGAGVTAPFAPSYPVHIKYTGQPDPLFALETTGNYTEMQLITAAGGYARITKDNGNTFGWGNYGFDVYNQNGPIGFHSGGTTDSTARSFSFTPSNMVFGNTAAPLTASGVRLNIKNGNSTQTVASATGATWDYLTIAAPTLTLSGNTATTTATGVNAIAVGAPLITTAAAITNSAALYLAGAPSIASGGGSITNAYAMWVDTGLSRFDGNGTHVFELPADATDPTGAGGAAVGRIPVLIGGALRYLAYY